MALSRTESQKVERWDQQYAHDYIAYHPFRPYFSQSGSNVVHLKRVGRGTATVGWNKVDELDSDDIENDAVLEGNEEAMRQRRYTRDITLYKSGVRASEIEGDWNALELRQVFREQLRRKAMKSNRRRFINALYSLDDVNFGSTTETQRDAWLTRNSDRVLFGADPTHTESDFDFSDSIVKLTNAADKMTQDMSLIAKEYAQSAGITPIMLNENMDEEHYVMFLPRRLMRDIKRATGTGDFQSAYQAVGERGNTNPVFTGASFIKDGIIYRELPGRDEDMYFPLGDNGIEVGAGFLCGEGALAYGLQGSGIDIRTNEFDYGTQFGIANVAKETVGKITYGTASGTDAGTRKDFGVVTVWAAAIAS